MQKNLSRSVNISTENAKKLFIIWLDNVLEEMMVEEA